ncbi:hypothetical protein PBAL39_13120 [Pedobacter sp. BAL39]|uniref:hypothetical protein n=1 Tax=Pedobacter sp. BAL39 TaxID=391596 RepID=UPI0001559562|nr:hypothetical protein [Pedobacter sp. BAL39]EDM35412.1 hypothetical protein PBAL39_13120 [Pedobacter sp. BAL39]
MKVVYSLYHIHIDERLEGGEDIKLIGIYSSYDSALNAQQRASKLEGFRDTPEEFEIFENTLDQDDWTSGFVTQT